MIKILSNTNDKSINEKIISLIINDKHMKLVGVDMLTPDNLSSVKAEEWIKKREWNEIMIILHEGFDIGFSQKMTEFIKKYIESNYGRYNILPLCYNVSENIPPTPVDGIKSISIDIHKTKKIDNTLKRRLESLLGTKVRERENKIFISYKSNELPIVEQIENMFEKVGYSVWRDEAKDDYDGVGNINIGEDVQKVIEENIKNASLLLLLETPDAIHSKWIKKEIEIAISNFIPILPICFKNESITQRGSRFTKLRPINRYVDITYKKKLCDEELDEILDEVELFLSQLFQNRHKYPYIIEEVFKDYNFNWEQHTPMKPIYKSTRREDRGMTKVFSHCSHYDGVFISDLDAYIDFIENNKEQTNQRIYFYGGSSLPIPEINDYYEKNSKYNDYKIYHPDELREKIQNNFVG